MNNKMRRINKLSGDVMATVPFEEETAKAITIGAIPGAIVTRYGYEVRIIAWDRLSKDDESSIVALVKDEAERIEHVFYYDNSGMSHLNDNSKLGLMMIVPKEMTYGDGDIVACYDRFDVKSIVVVKGSSLKIRCHEIKYYACYKNGMLSYDGSIQVDVIPFPATTNEVYDLESAMRSDGSMDARIYMSRFFHNSAKHPCK